MSIPPTPFFFDAHSHWLAFAPAASADRLRRLAGGHVGLIAAETLDFGVALEQAQARALDMGYRSVALVASDLPHLRAERYEEAFAALEQADVALGPCADGGYYLLATSKKTPRLFRAIAWSTETVYASTLTRAGEARLRVATLEPCDDVDTPADLVPLFSALSARPGAGHSLAALLRLGFGPSDQSVGSRQRATGSGQLWAESVPSP